MDVSKDSVTIRYNDYSEEFTWPLSEIREDISNKDLYFFLLYLEYISLVVATGMYISIFMTSRSIGLVFISLMLAWLGSSTQDIVYILVTGKVGYMLPI